MIYAVIILFVVLVLTVANVLNIADNKYFAIWGAVLPHSLLIILHVFSKSQTTFLNIVFSCLLILLCAFAVIKFNFLPLKKRKSIDKRLNILIGGRKLLLSSIYVFIVQTVFYILLFANIQKSEFTMSVVITDLMISIAFFMVLYFNGYWRIIILSRRLNVFKKVVFVCLMWIPLVSFFCMMTMCRSALIEYDHELYKINQNNIRIETKVCRTKYPLVMLHGVGFRDLKYINYWGRIPRQLMKNGASVYYGNQEAWGTIEANAEDVKRKIMDIVENTGAEKVNIIAHSKGGLDARYMISRLGMEDYVASLTTMSTPHRGSFVMDFANKLPAKFIDFVGRQVDRTFKVFGDKNPDFKTASRQFLTENAAKFNEEVIDSKKVYYQSYTTVMSRAHSDYILFFPFLIGRFARQKNDGLVSVESAKWGNFRGVLETKRLRGISHGDIVDLRRHDYKGFDAREFYVQMVAELKEMGY